MRIDIKKFLFVGLEEEKSIFFKEAQKLGLVHFIVTSSTKAKEVPEEVLKLRGALKVLRGFESCEEVSSEISPHELAREILILKSDLEMMEEREQFLRQEIARIAPFGNFSKEDVNFIEQASEVKFHYFCAKEEIASLHPELIHLACSEGLNYYVSLVPLHDIRMIEVKFERPVGDVQKELDSTLKSHFEVERALHSYAKYSSFLHEALVDALNHFNLMTSQTVAKTPLQGLFTIEGWVPENKVKELQELAKGLSLSMEEVAVEPSDALPTYLENEGLGRMGEDLVHIYDTPSTSDKDPSLWVLMTFGVFFAFIVGDAGYGAIYLGLCLWLRQRYSGVGGLQKRMLHMAILLCSFCIVWGIFVNSYFGMVLAEENPLKKYSLITWLAAQKGGGATADSILMELALFVGVVHVLTGMVRAFRRNPSFMGWILFIAGGYLYLPHYLGTESLLNYIFHVHGETGAVAGLYLMGTGIFIAVAIAIYRYRLLGLTEIMNMIQVFADVLSYLRLYALALAGSILAGVINEAAAGLPLVLGVLLFLIAHLVNMALGVMGGVIHGLRLNFIEWYHYSFEGGGRKFKPLELYRKKDE